MTRETKIGLFVGMGVIILIGILISDHLSDAQRQQHAPLNAALEGIDDPRDRPFTPDESAGMRDGFGQTGLTGGPAPPPVDLNAAEVGPAHPPRDAFEGSVLRQDIYQLQSQTDSGADLAQRDVPTDRGHTALPSEFSRVTPPPGVSRADAEQIRRLGPAGAGNTASAAPRVRYHYVKEGETLSSIASHYYGQARHYQLIYEANRDKLSSPNAVRPRIQLVIPPDPAQGEGAPAVADADASSRSTAASAGAASSSGTKEYTVKEGDTLSSIAEQFYGSQNKWTELHKLNKDRLPNANRLRAGMTLRVPTSRS